MKHFILKTLSLALIAVVFTSCNGWKELAKDYYTVTPDPLEVNGGKVSLTSMHRYLHRCSKRLTLLKSLQN